MQQLEEEQEEEGGGPQARSRGSRGLFGVSFREAPRGFPRPPPASPGLPVQAAAAAARLICIRCCYTGDVLSLWEECRSNYVGGPCRDAPASVL